VTRRWHQDKRPIKGTQPSAKRINHAGDVLGCLLTVFGGYETEQKRVLDDIVLYDLEEHAWVHGDIRYHSKRDPERIAARAKHSVTAVLYNPNSAPEFTEKNPHCVKWSRRMWFDKKLQKAFNPANFEHEGTSHFRYGVFIFGWFSAASEKALGDLWLLQPHTQINESTIVDKNDPSSLYRDRASAYLVGYNVTILAFNVSKIAKGKPPVARFAH
jgi:hypothetical protein